MNLLYLSCVLPAKKRIGRICFYPFWEYKGKIACHPGRPFGKFFL